MKLIRVRYCGATNKRGARLFVDDGDGNRLSVSANQDSVPPDELFCWAAQQLATSRGWGNVGLSGEFKGDRFFTIGT